MDGSQRPRPPPPTVANQPQRPFITAPGVAYVTGAAAMYGRASPTGYYDAQGRWFAYPGAPYATAAAAPYAAAAAAPYSAGYPAPSYAAVAGSAYVNVGAAPASATASTTPPKPAFTAVTFRPQSTIPARKKLINATPAVHAVQTAMPLRPLSVSQSGAGSGTASASSSTASPEWPDSLK